MRWMPMGPMTHLFASCLSTPAVSGEEFDSSAWHLDLSKWKRTKKKNKNNGTKENLKKTIKSQKVFVF